MSADIAHSIGSTTQPGRRSAAAHLRARAVLALGPLTAAAGAAWALAQPWRVTLLHPLGQGFWWLVAEPPLYVLLVGVLFRLVLAPGIVADLLGAAADAEEREP